jgi:hypothetical protein
MRGTAGNMAAPATKWKNCLRGSVMTSWNVLYKHTIISNSRPNVRF